LVSAEKDVLFYPNGEEILMYEFFDGKLLRRLRRSERRAPPADVKSSSGQRNFSDRLTALAWRAHNVELYSAHSDGSITAWTPRTEEDATLDEEEEEEKDRASGTKRKRGILEEIYQDLTKRKMTFGS
jgi:DNA excision repair protein ERCC-8